MSTPPNPPSTPSGPETEPAGTPVPEAASIPAPAEPLSLEKLPAEAAEAPEDAAPADAPPAARTETPADARTEPPATVPAEAQPETPGAEATTPAPQATPAPAEAPAPAPAPAPAAFAPVTPAPAAATAPPYGAPYATPGAPGAPGAPAPANPWASPLGGFQAAPHPAGFPPPPPESNGMALAALLLGLFGILVGLIPFFFWAGALLAVTGLGLGIAAVVRSRAGAPRATMAAWGTALALLGLGASVGGWFITQAVIDKIDKVVAEDRLHSDYDDLDPVYPATPPPPAPKPTPPPVPGLSSALPFGTAFTYPSGVEVKVSTPKKYRTESPYIKVGNAVQMTVTITNNSTETLSVIYAVPNVRDEQGVAGKLVFDGDMPKTIKGDILPGASATGIIAYEVPKGTANLTADITPGGRLEPVKYSGPIG